MLVCVLEKFNVQFYYFKFLVVLADMVKGLGSSAAIGVKDMGNRRVCIVDGRLPLALFRWCKILKEIHSY